MISQARFYGGARLADPAAALVILHPDLARVWTLDPGGPGGTARVPDASLTVPHVQEGHLHLFAVNIGADAVDLQAPDGQSLGDIDPGGAALIHLVERGADDPIDEWRASFLAAF